MKNVENPPTTIGSKEDANRAVAAICLKRDIAGNTTYLGRRINPVYPLSCFIYFSGLPLGDRLALYYYGDSCYLSPCSFRLLFILAHTRFLSDILPLAGSASGPWVAQEDLEPANPQNASKYIYRLKRELSTTAAADLANAIHNDRSRSYCLDLPGDHLLFDYRRLRKLAIPDIPERVARIQQLFPADT